MRSNALAVRFKPRSTTEQHNSRPTLWYDHMVGRWAHVLRTVDPGTGGTGPLDRFGTIDPREPLAALGMQSVTGVEPVSGGQDTFIWRVDTPGGAYALRLFRSEQRDQWAHEVRAMRAVRARGVSVPRVTAHGIWRDRPAILMEWCDGRPVLEEVLTHPELTEALGASMGCLQARLHALSVPRYCWDNHRSWLDRAGPNEGELRARLRARGLRDGHILHLDFHPRNVLCVGQEVTVLLDWANVTVGDPRADVARTRSILQLVTPPPSVSGPDFAVARAKLERAWTDGYAQQAGPQPDMALFEIWAGVVFIRDMEQHLGKPDFWMGPSDFDRLRDHVATLKQRAGLRA
jgi:Ser/Thr protein kinase RdoA (MazF antagonist)